MLWTGTEHVGLLQEYLGVLNEAFFEGVGLLNTSLHGAAPILTGEAGSASAFSSPIEAKGIAAMIECPLTDSRKPEHYFKFWLDYIRPLPFSN